MAGGSLAERYEAHQHGVSYHAKSLEQIESVERILYFLGGNDGNRLRCFTGERATGSALTLADR